MTGEVINSSAPITTESFADLWDGYDSVSKASERGVLLLKDILKFFKKRAASEDEYSKSLSKLVLKFEALAPDGYVGSQVKNTWDQIRLESLSHSTYHENICNNIQTQICEPIEGLIVDLEQKIKVIHSDAEKSFLIYQESVTKLKKSKINYEKLVKESMEITGVSKGETQKVQKRAIKAAQDVIKADKEYRSQIMETNQQQKLLLSESLPRIMGDLQRLETIRIHFIKSYFLKYFKSIEGQPKLTTDNDSSIIQMIQLIQTEEEIQEYIKKVKITQNIHSKPKPFEYEPYTTTPSNLSVVGSNSPFSISVSPSNSFNNGNMSPLTTSSNGNSLFNNSGNGNGSSNNNSFNNSSNERQSLTGSTGMTVDPSPTKEKRPGGWSLKRLSSSISFDKKSINRIEIKTAIFNCRIDDIMNSQKAKYPNLDIPFVLVILKRKLEQLDFQKTQGIFRVPGNVVDINSYKKRFDDGNFEFSISENVYTIASLLKAWLRELPEPLFPTPIYDQCVQSCENVDAILNIISQLPINSQKVLSYIIQLLQDAMKPEYVEISKMGSDNLSMVFSPCFLRSPYTDANILLGNIIKEKEFVKNIIDNFKPIPLNDELIDSLQIQLKQTLNKAIESPPQSPLVTKSKSMIYGSSSSTTTPSKPIPMNLNNGNKITSPITSPNKELPSPSSTPISPIKMSPPNSSPIMPMMNPKIALLKQSEPTIQITPPTPSTSPNTPLSPSMSSSNSIDSSNQNTSITITPPVTPQPKSSSSVQKNPYELLSPSEIKRRSNLQYQDEQESVKELIDMSHTYVNELYSDITTNETTCYYAMQSSLSICKFTKSLEQYIINDMQMSTESLVDSVRLNKFVSPPGIQFKIPSNLPKLVPSASETLLRNWLSVVTLTVNRLNQYLCYFGGIVLRIYSPDQIETISSLFENLESLKPIDKPQYRSLTIEQADTLTTKILPLLEPLNPFTPQELNFNSNQTTSESSIENISNQFPIKMNLNLDTNIDKDNDNNNNDIYENDRISNVTSPLTIQSQNEEQQFKFDDESSSNNLLEMMNKNIVNTMVNQISSINRMFTEKLVLLEQMDFSNTESQLEIKLTAKLSLALKRELEEYIADNNIELEQETNPIINNDIDNVLKLKIMTNFFIGRIELMLSTILNNHTPLNNNLVDILSKYL